MNETIALNRLAALLAQRSGLSNSESEKFVKLFFAQIENALSVNGDVTINGLGRFYLQNNSETPIAFEIDPKLSATLNQPFEMFDAIKLPEGINPEDLEEIDAVAATPTPPQSPDIEEQLDNTSETEDNTPETENKPVESVSTEPVTADAIEIEQLASVNQPGQIVTTEDESDSIDEDFCDKPQRNYSILKYAVIAILFLAIGFVAGKLTNKTTDNIPADEASLAHAAQDSLPVTDSVSISQDIASVEDSLSAVVVDTATTTVVEIYDTVTPQRFLTTMARQYYGQMEYWAFIYQANAEHLGHPNRIAPGTKVLIPSPESFIIEGESPEQTLERAKRLGTEIYDKNS